MTPEMIAAVRQMLHQQYMSWLDTPLPVLGGRSPREVCGSESGRRQVATLIRAMPDPMGSAPVEVPREMLLRELGLADGSANSPPRGKQARRSRPEETKRAGGQRVRPNEPCPCGSGRKYKKCCGRGR